MNPNPAVGVLYHWLGGLASGSFYVPYRGVKGWAWETFWLAGGFFSWIIAPWFLAGLLTKDLFAVLHEAPSLGMAMVLGLCAAFGTLMPPIFSGIFMSQVVGTTSGRVILLGIFVCLLGIAVAGLAGISKERNREAQAEPLGG